MHKSSDGYGYWIVAIIIWIIVIIIIICLLAWAFRAAKGDSGQKDFCLKSGGNWTGHGLTQNVNNLGQNKAFRVEIDLNVQKVYTGTCGNTIVHVKYHWKRFNSNGSVLAQDTEEAFGPVSHDGSIYLTETSEQALLKLTPLPNNKIEYIYTEFSSSPIVGKVVTIATLNEIGCSY